MDGVELVLREAPTAGYVHVSPRVRAVRPARDLIQLARDELQAQARDVRLDDAARMTTDEGEHAVLASLSARAADRRIGRELGIVFTDDFMAVVDAAFEAEHRALFQSFVAQIVKELPLGAERSRRRVEFQCPPGWAPRSRGLMTHVFAPSYSSDGTLLSVLPAETCQPHSLLRAVVYEDIVENLRDLELLPHRRVDVPSGLSGELAVARGKVGRQFAQVQAVTLHDRDYRYTVRLESRREIPPEEVILPVASSLLPVPQRTPSERSTVLSYLVD